MTLNKLECCKLCLNALEIESLLQQRTHIIFFWTIAIFQLPTSDGIVVHRKVIKFWRHKFDSRRHLHKIYSKNSWSHRGSGSHFCNQFFGIGSPINFEFLTLAPSFACSHGPGALDGTNFTLHQSCDLNFHLEFRKWVKLTPKRSIICIDTCFPVHSQLFPSN